MIAAAAEEHNMTARTCGKVVFDPHTADRDLLAAIDESIAKVSECRHCGSSVHVETTQPNQPYKSWLVCDNTGCGRSFPME
jgi:hypothetical protein